MLLQNVANNYPIATEHTTEKGIRSSIFYVRWGPRSYFELHSSFLKPTYVTYLHRVADEHKTPRPSRRPTRLWSSAEVSARRT
jgi:hypothetical protein